MSKIKVLALLLALAMVASLFVACQPKDEGNVDSGDKSSDASNVDEKPNEPKEDVELIWWHWGNAPKKPDAVIEALNEQSKKDIGVTIKFNWATDNDEKLKNVMATGEYYDIAFTCNWFANYVISAQNGQLMDITDMLPEVAPDLWNYIPESVWDGSRVGGKIYAVPSYKDTAAAQYWLVNKEFVIDQAGAEAELNATGELVSTVTPLLEKVKAYADANGGYPNDCKAAFNYNKAGLNGHDNGWDQLCSPCFVGVRWNDADHKVVSYLENEQYINDIKTLKDWYDRGLVNSDCLQVDSEPEFIVVSTAQGWEGAEAIWGNQKPYTVQINKKFGPLFTTAAIQGAMNGVGVNSKYGDRALEYLEYLNTNKVYRNMIAWGVEGVNWENKDGNAVSLNDDWQPGVFSQGSFFELYPQAPAAPDMYANLKKQQDAAEASELCGFVPDLSAVEAEVAACSAVMAQYENSIKCGVLTDVDATFKKVLDEMNAAGLDKIIAELQAQVDEYVG